MENGLCGYDYVEELEMGRFSWFIQVSVLYRKAMRITSL